MTQKIEAVLSVLFTKLVAWIDSNIFAIGRDMRLSYLPPLMVYAAYGISGLTNIVGLFYVKERLGLSAEFLAALGFWAGLPWALKMPVGHLVDLIWKWKSLLVYLGAALLAISLGIMCLLLGNTEAMLTIAPAGNWFVTATILAPIGYVLQDVVADAMTVEAVPKTKETGEPFNEKENKEMHTTMQTFGRMAIVGGGILVSLASVILLEGVGNLSEQEQNQRYLLIYQLALSIPLVSIFGVSLASIIRKQKINELIKKGNSKDQAESILNVRGSKKTQVNWWILGGGLIFSVVSVAVGLGNFGMGQEIVFLLSMAIVILLINRLVKELDVEARRVLVGTAIVIFVFRGIPTPGPGVSWWMIDVLQFDQQFLAQLSLIASTLALFGMFIFRRFMSRHSISYVVGFLTIAATILAIPIIGMYFGFHEWTAALTGGVVDARFIAVIDTALESPLGQIAMIPMLAWIANSAPAHLKATFFAVMASFANLALSAAQLGTKYMNQIFLIEREVKDRITGETIVAADYSELGMLLITVTIIGFVLPISTIAIIKFSRFNNA